MKERRREGRLRDDEVTLDLFENAAGGVVAKASHRETKRFATGHGKTRDEARHEALRELTQIMRRTRLRRERGFSELP